MKITMGRITTDSYELALDVCKGLEASGKYECTLHPGRVLDSIRKTNNSQHEITVNALESPDKTPIGFADEEDKG